MSAWTTSWVGWSGGKKNIDEIFASPGDKTVKNQLVKEERGGYNRSEIFRRKVPQ